MPLKWLCHSDKKKQLEASPRTHDTGDAEDKDKDMTGCKSWKRKDTWGGLFLYNRGERMAER